MSVIPQDGSRTPAHVAIIMDGNARWAKANNVALHNGHRKGAEALKAMLEPCVEQGISVLSVYAFSQENWGRPETEVTALMQLLDWYLRREIATLVKHDIRLVVSGDLSRFTDATRQQIERAVERTKNADKLVLNICLNYGGRQELVQACQRIVGDYQASGDNASSITPASISQKLYTHALPDPDLLIRTGGDMRISNFLLWQCAYTELYFTDCLWPDFDADALKAACIEYADRERRYGKR